MDKQVISFAVETENGIVKRIGRSVIAVSEVKFRGGARCTFPKGRRRACGAILPLRSPALRPGTSGFPALRSLWRRIISAAWA